MLLGLEQESQLSYQATYAESGSLDQVQSIQEANDISQQLIDKYKLEAGKDYFYNSQGLIDITDSAKQEIQETAQRNSIDASIRADLLDLGTITRQYRDTLDEATAGTTYFSNEKLKEYGLDAKSDGVNLSSFISNPLYSTDEKGRQYISSYSYAGSAANVGENQYVDNMLYNMSNKKLYDMGKYEIDGKYQAQLNQQQKQIQNSYYATLTEIASLGGLTDAEKAATEILSKKMDADAYAEVIDDLDARFGKAVGTEGGKVTEDKARDQLYDYLKEKYNNDQVASEEYAKIISSESFNALTDTQAKANYLIETTKEIAFQDRVQGELQAQTQKINQFEAAYPGYKDLSNQSFNQVNKYIKNLDTFIGEVTAGDIDAVDKDGKLINGQFRIGEDTLFGIEYMNSEVNRAVTTLSQAIGQYTSDGSMFGEDNGELLGVYSRLTLGQMEKMGNVLQDYGEVFGTSLGDKLLTTINRSDNKDILLSELSSIDLSGSTINSLYNLKNYEGIFKTEIKDLFAVAKESIGGDSGIFAALTQDQTIQKVVDNFKELGDIDAAAIMKAAHSSSDLAQALEIADFNAGGLSLALQGIASGAISQGQVTDSLLGVLSDISAIESNSAVAFDAMNNLKLSAHNRSKGTKTLSHSAICGER